MLTYEFELCKSLSYFPEVNLVKEDCTKSLPIRHEVKKKTTTSWSTERNVYQTLYHFAVCTPKYDESILVLGYGTLTILAIPKCLGFENIVH